MPRSRICAIAFAVWLGSAVGAATDSSFAPLHIDEREALTLRAEAAGLSPAERAAHAEAAIDAALADARCGPEQLLGRRAGDVVEIVLCGRPVLAVTAADAGAEGATLDETARRWETALRDGFAAAKRRNYGQALLRGAILGLLLPLLLVGLGFLLRAATLRIQARILRVPDEGVRAGPLRFLSTDGERRFLAGVIGLLRGVAYVILVYAFLAIFFRQLPWTRDVAAAMLAPFADVARHAGPDAIAFLPRLVLLVLVAAVLRLAFKSLDRLVAQARAGHVRLGPLLSADTAFVAGQTAKIALVVVGFVVGALLLPGIGRQILLGLLATAALAVAFGARDATADLLAGLTILYGRPFRTGNRVRIGSVEGRVERKGLLLTFVRRDDGDLLLLPNREVLSATVSLPGQLKVLEGTVIAESVRGIEAIVGLLRHAGVESGCRRDAGILRFEGIDAGRVVFRVTWPMPSGADPADVQDAYLRALAEHAPKLEIRLHDVRVEPGRRP